MTDIERMATTASHGISSTIRRLSSLVISVIAVAGVVGLATFATGAWVFDNSIGWLVVGGMICLIPVGAAVLAWFLVRSTAGIASRLAGDLKSFLSTSSTGAGTLIDHDSGVALGMQAKSFRQMRTELYSRRHELPALYAGVRAITSVPGLAAVSFLGIVMVGALGTVLLLVGLVG